MSTTRAAGARGRAGEEDEAVLGHDASERPLRSAADAELLLHEILGSDADGLLQVARRHSICFDDAHDAYQRALELFFAKARDLRADTAREYLYTVVKNEAKRFSLERRRALSGGDVLPDVEARTVASPEEQLLEEDEVRRAAEALDQLKQHHTQALLMQASGRTYADIQEVTGWTYSKVNRCIKEGRKDFAKRLARLESGEACQEWAPTLAAMVAGSASDKVLERVRPHLRGCQSCQATVRALHAADHSLGALAPVVLVGSAVPAADLPERATGFVTRLHEALVTHLGDRAAVATMKAQPLLEVSTATKVAAVAASAAVVAGGGVAVHEQTGRPAARTPEVRQAERRPAPPSSPVAAPVVTTQSSAQTATAVRSEQQSRAGRQVRLSAASQRRLRIDADRRARAAAARRRASDQFDPTLTPTPTSSGATPAPSQQFTPTTPANPLAPPPTSSPSTGGSPSTQFTKPSTSPTDQFG